jgi:hypothetical protein
MWGDYFGLDFTSDVETETGPFRSQLQVTTTKPDGGWGAPTGGGGEDVGQDSPELTVRMRKELQ